MKRLLISCALALPIVGADGRPCAGRRQDPRQVAGQVRRHARPDGRHVRRQGREGRIVATTAVKGNRKATINDTTGRIIDLSEEKVYDLDLKKKTYTVDHLRRVAPADAGGAGEGRRRRRARRRRRPPRKASRRSREAGEGIRGRLRREGDRTEEADRRLRRARSRSSRSPSARRARRSRRAAAS